MRQIRLYFDAAESTIGYHIDLDNKHFQMGRMTPEGDFEDLVQDETYGDAQKLLRQIQTLLAVELSK